MKTFKEIREGAENYTMKKGPYTRKVDGKTADRMKRQGWKLVAREEVEEARQMKDPKKDSMVQKGGKTIVIDKSKEKEYLRKGWSLAENVSLEEKIHPKEFSKLRGTYKDKISGAVIEFDSHGFVVEPKNGKVVPFEWKNMMAEAVSPTQQAEAFEPHKMYDPKTGKEYDAKTKDDHERMKKLGYSHEKPEVKESVLEAYFQKELEPSDYIRGSEKMYVDIIKKNGGKNIKVYKPTSQDPQLGMDFEGGNIKKITQELKKRGDGTETIDEAISYGRPKKSTEKDSADVDDYKATSDDRKAADKNVIMQIRRGVDMPKGCTVTFQDGKTQKFPQKACQLVSKKFDSFKKPAVRKKFQDEINKSLSSMKKAMNMKG